MPWPSAAGIAGVSARPLLAASAAGAQTPPQRVVAVPSAVLVTTTATTARVATPTGTVLWEGPTTWQGEDLGMRTRDALTVERGVVVRERYEEGGGPCGVGEVPSERWVVDASLRFVRAPDTRLAALAQSAFAGAEASGASVVAGASPALPLRGSRGRLADGAAVSSRALEDGDARTTQALTAGSFVTVRPSLGPVALRAMELTSAPGGDLPRRWLLAAEPGGFGARDAHARVLMTARRAGRVRVMLPTMERAECVTLVALDPGVVGDLG